MSIFRRPGKFAAWILAAAMLASSSAQASGSWLTFTEKEIPEEQAYLVQEYTGTVRVTLPALPESVILHPDQRLNVKGETVRIDPVDAASVCLWTEDTMVFDATAFKDILTCLSYRYNVRIDNRSGVPPDKLISMTVGPESLGEVMSLLGTLLSFRTDIQDHNVTIY